LPRQRSSVGRSGPLRPRARRPQLKRGPLGGVRYESRSPLRPVSTPSSGPRRAYVDTCVISGLARGELSPADSGAFLAISDAVAKSDVSLWASTVAKREIDQVPAQFRREHEREYSALGIVRASNTTNWIDDRPGSVTYGQRTVNPIFEAIGNIVSDRTDAEHLYQAKVNGIVDFITIDKRTILNKANELRRFGLRVYSPAQYQQMVIGLGPST
jgi:hypothetical protein